MRYRRNGCPCPSHKLGPWGGLASGKGATAPDPRQRLALGEQERSPLGRVCRGA